MEGEKEHLLHESLDPEMSHMSYFLRILLPRNKIMLSPQDLLYSLKCKLTYYVGDCALGAEVSLRWDARKHDTEDWVAEDLCVMWWP